ncbi:MAG: hypothetical protein WBP40_04345 [Candidatus Moraniibacteriota bacterium]
MGFEDPERSAIRQVDRAHSSPEYLHPVVEKAYAKATALFERDAIQPDAFVPPYDARQVAEDKETVKRLESKFGSEDLVHKKYADVLEAIIYEHIEQSDWFGPTAQTIKTSKYDDYVNGIDLVTEFSNDDQSLTHLGLGIDVTFGTTAMHKKFQRIREEISTGKLATVKYFESERSPHKGIYRDMPRVVIGAEREHITELAARWMDPKMNRELATHPVQAMLLDEIEAQLSGFRQYARTMNQARLIPIFDRQLAIIKKIRVEKSRTVKNPWPDDRVFGAIRGELDFFRS